MQGQQQGFCITKEQASSGLSSGAEQAAQRKMDSRGIRSCKTGGGGGRTHLGSPSEYLQPFPDPVGEFVMGQCSQKTERAMSPLSLSGLALLTLFLPLYQSVSCCYNKIPVVGYFQKNGDCLVHSCRSWGKKNTPSIQWAHLVHSQEETLTASQ